MCNYLKYPSKYSQLLCTGRSPMLTACETRRLLNTSAEGEKSLEELRKDLQLPVSEFTVRRTLQNCGFVQYF